MSLQRQLDEAAQQKRSDDLDVREKWISEKEKLLDDSERVAKLEVLDKQIEAKQKVLYLKNQAILDIDDQLKTKEADYKELWADIESLKNTKITHNDAVNAQAIKLKTLNSNLSKQNNTLKSDIQANKTYLRDQEEVVNNTIAEWNVRLNELQQEADDIETQKTQQLVILTRFDQDKTDVENVIEKLADKLDYLQVMYDEKAAILRDQLKTLELEIAAQIKDRDESVILAEIREKNLVAREKSVKIKEVVLKKTEYNLGQKEKKLKSDYGLAGLDYATIMK